MTSMAGRITGIFNFEGGCYAKTIHLSPKAEPEIHATTTMFASVVENMVYDPHTRELDFHDEVADAEHALRLSAALYPERLADAGWPASRRTSSC